MAKTTSRAQPNFLVVQNGARRGYAVPEAFGRVSALAGVYTDLTAQHGFGRLLASIARREGAFAQALTRRSPPQEIAQMVYTNETAFFMKEAAQRFINDRDIRDWLVNLSTEMAERSMIARGTAGATHIYTMLGEGGAFVKKAKEAGLGIIGDVYIALSSDEIVAREAEAYPDWADEQPATHKGSGVRSDNKIILDCSDLLICPSAFVRDDLIANHGIDVSRTRIIPYAVSSPWLQLQTSPERGRLLFAGSATLRKGIHYLAMAAYLLKSEYQIFVAGEVSNKVRHHPLSKNLLFLGHLSKAQMAAQFARADVFVFPSLAEGSAGVTAEALGAGVPVVTTMAAGSIVRDGVDGIIIPERDPAAIVEAVHSIIEDREKRNSMGRAARERAQAFTWDGFASQVIEATERISEEPCR